MKNIVLRLKVLALSILPLILIQKCNAQIYGVSLTKTEIDFGSIYYGQGAKDTVYMKNTNYYAKGKIDSSLIKDTGHNNLYFLKFTYGNEDNLVMAMILGKWERTFDPITPNDSIPILVAISGKKSGNVSNNIIIHTSSGDVSIKIKAFVKDDGIIEFKNKSVILDSIYKDTTAVFKFYNKGNEPLFIQLGGDGGFFDWAAPFYSNNPTLPGDSGIISIYIPTRRCGPFEKGFSVTTNTPEHKFRLKVKGEIIKCK